MTCQYPELASRTENTLASGILDTISLTVIVGKSSRLMALLRSLGSMHYAYLAVRFGHCDHAVDPFGWFVDLLDDIQLFHPF